MEFVQALWLPIVVSGVFVLVANFVIWMVSPLHKGEWSELADEKGFMGALIEMGTQPGNYVFPSSDGGKRMKDPAYIELLNRGPCGILTVWRGAPNMGLNMAMTLLVCMLISLFVAYVAYQAPVPAGSPYLHVFRITGAMAVAIYTFGKLPHDVWFRTPKATVIRQMVDGVICGLVTAGVFAWLWPRG